MSAPQVVVIGGGAAGTMAAIAAATAGARTLLLERTRDGGRKILISGGGRCNILPASVDESRFVTESSPHLLRKMLRAWPLREQIEFFQHEATIPLIEEPGTGKLFPASNSARDVRDRLFALARNRGVAMVFESLVTGLVPVEPAEGEGHDAQPWRIERDAQAPLYADAVIVATGGLSVPSTGSDGLGLSIIERLGHTIHRTYPALTPLTNESAGPFAPLAGVSLSVGLRIRANGLKASASGGFLFTHHGYSGPAVLDISHVAVRARTEMGTRPPVEVCWSTVTEDQWEQFLRSGGAKTALNIVAAHLPARLAAALLSVAEVEPGRTLANLTREERSRLIKVLRRTELPWTGDEGYKKAEVTGGGVDLSEIDPKTMESRLHKRLYLCGEMLDAFGPIGGFNFQWAWATGRSAGLSAARC